MHELSIATDMVEIIKDRLGGIKPLASVTVTMGPLSGVSPDSLSFCFASVCREAGCGSPDLVIHSIKAQARCTLCDITYELEDFYAACPKCLTMNREVISGDRFTLDSIEIQEDEHAR